MLLGVIDMIYLSFEMFWKKITKRKLWCFKGDAVKFFSNPCFCFGHNLVISYPN